MPIARKMMIHLNGHMCCSVDTETTGLIAGYHEICQIAIVPLNSCLEINENYPIFDVKIRPNYPERIDPKSMEINKRDTQEILDTGFPREGSVDLFEAWYIRLQLAEGKRITPLAQNWAFDLGFIKHWMGDQHCNHYFDGRTRDTLTVASYLNDKADFAGEQIPFPGSMKLIRLAARLGIEVDPKLTHDGLYDAVLTARVYKEMVKEIFV